MPPHPDRSHITVSPTRSKGPVWAAGTVVLVSALWGAALIGLHLSKSTSAETYFGSEPDTRGYHVVDNLCNTADFTPVDRTSFKVDTSLYGGPQSFTHRHEALDIAECSIVYLEANTNQGRMVLSSTLFVHKKTNPIPDFRAEFETADSPGLDGRSNEVESVPNLGDSAYLSSRDAAGEHTMVLTVRDGWAVYQVRASNAMNAASEQSDLGKEAKRQMLTLIAKATLPKLRQ